MTMRSQWGPDLAWNPSPDCAPGPEIARTFKFAVVHHTVNSNTYAPNESTGIARAIWQYHVGTLGYCDIAYNFLIDRYGKIFEGRMGGIDRAVIAAHTGGFNTGSTGIAWIGTWTTEQPPQDGLGRHGQPARVEAQHPRRQSECWLHHDERGRWLAMARRNGGVVRERDRRPPRPLANGVSR